MCLKLSELASVFTYVSIATTATEASRIVMQAYIYSKLEEKQALSLLCLSHVLVIDHFILNLG